MAQVSYPGVYIEEVPSAVRAIAGVSTSTAAFVDRFRRGDTTRPIELFGLADFERELGGIDPASPASYAIAQFFLNGGSHAWAVRVAPDATAASVRVSAGTSGATQITITAREVGAWANQRVRVRIDPSDLAGAVDIAVVEYVSTDPAARALVQERFVRVATADLVAAIGGSSQVLASASGTPTAAINGLVWTLAPLTAADITGLRNQTFQVVLSPPGLAITRTATLAWSASDPPTTPQAVVAQIERAIRTAGADVPALAGATAQLKNGLVIVRLGRGGYHPGASVRFAPTTGTPLVTLGYATATTTLAISSPQEYVLGAPAAWGTDVGGYVGATAALDAGLPSASALIGNPATKTGMYQLLDVDLFNILCIPAAAELPTPSEVSAVYTAAEMLCADERAFLIVDVPPSVRTLEAAAQWASDYSGLRHPNAAVYFPRVQVPDPTAGFALRTIGASGTVAGVFARTDAERGVWQAPAGVDAVLRGVDELDARLTDPENGVLNKLAVNCLRGFPAQGRIVWGARTLDGADNDVGDWKYIPVRRLALMIEESLYRGTRWAVFQPNDEPLWARLRQNVGAYMHRLFRQRAFQGATPREAYYVKCDRELNPPEDRELGIVTVEVGFAPLKPAEFVVIRIQQIAEMA